MTHSSLVSKESTTGGSAPPPVEERTTNGAYRLVPVACVLFIINILSMLATTMADPSVEINRQISAWFDRTAPVSISVFVVLIVGLIFAGFRIDRKQAQLRYDAQLAAWEARMAEKMAPSPGGSETSASPENET
ncbi:MAG TPA: hypothetical protein VMM56_05490 [Planctomycetaceae bacterium]|nr:hypothetical protein [Planctomycetaceae bacterium]